MLRATGESDAGWATSPQTLKPIYLLQTAREINRSFRQIKRRLRDRMVAGRMAYPFLQQANCGEVPKLPAGVKRLSINAMSELVLDDAGQTDPENVETRVWHPSLPVIHLATAVHGYLHLYDGAAEQPGMDRSSSTEMSSSTWFAVRSIVNPWLAKANGCRLIRNV